MIARRRSSAMARSWPQHKKSGFSRKKHDPRFPKHAIAYCLETAQTTIADLDHIVFYDKPLLKFERLLETYLAYAPKGFRSFLAAMPIWLKRKALSQNPY